jgi:hypothetical protein
MSIISIIKRLNPFKTRRIIEYRGRFIPQYRKDGFLWHARSISDNYSWYSLNYQLKYCSFNTIEEAREFAKSTQIIKHYN